MNTIAIGKERYREKEREGGRQKEERERERGEWYRGGAEKEKDTVIRQKVGM